MSIRPLALLVVACLALPLACAKPRGDSASEKRAYVRTMRNETLAAFYRANPGLRSRVQNAAGYAVFSDVSVKIFVVATGHGYGLAVDNRTGRERQSIAFFAVPGYETLVRPVLSPADEAAEAEIAVGPFMEALYASNWA